MSLAEDTAPIEYNMPIQRNDTGSVKEKRSTTLRNIAKKKKCKTLIFYDGLVCQNPIVLTPETSAGKTLRKQNSVRPSFFTMVYYERTAEDTALFEYNIHIHRNATRSVKENRSVSVRNTEKKK